MSRNLLHKSKLDDFKLWLDSNGIEHRPTDANYQVLQIRVTPRKKPAFWASVFDRLDAKEHFTTDYRLDSLVQRYCIESRKTRNAA